MIKFGDGIKELTVNIIEVGEISQNIEGAAHKFVGLRLGGESGCEAFESFIKAGQLCEDLLLLLGEGIDTSGQIFSEIFRCYCLVGLSRGRQRWRCESG